MPSWEAFLELRLFDPSTFAGAVIYAILLIVVARVIIWIMRKAIQKVLERDQRGLIDRTTAAFLTQLGGILIHLVAVILYFQLIPPLRAVGAAILAGVSVASIVIGFAAQSTLANLVAGISLLIYRPFRIGDRLQVTAPTGIETGVVENLTLGYTLLVTPDNRRIVMPNSVIVNQVMLNLSAIDSRMIVGVPIGIGYSSDIDRARAILLDLAQKTPNVAEVIGCPVTALGNSAVMLTTQVWCNDPSKAKGIEFALYEEAKKAFDAANIEIPFPYSNVILQKSEEASAGK